MDFRMSLSSLRLGNEKRNFYFNYIKQIIESLTIQSQAYFGFVLLSETESDFSSVLNVSRKERMPFPTSPMVFESRPGPKMRTMITRMIKSSGQPRSNIFLFLSK